MKKAVCILMVLAVSGFALSDIVENGNNIEVNGEGNTLDIVDNADLQIGVKPGATLNVRGGSIPVTIHAQDANVKILSWKEKVVFWLDAAATDSFTFDDEGTTHALDPEGFPALAEKKFPIITHWHDRRGEEGRYAAWSWRGSGENGVKSCNAILAKDEQGLPFVSFGKYAQYGRRMEFYEKGVFDYQKRVKVPFKFAAVVFGSQSGGGQSIISALKRATNAITPPTKDDPLFYLKVPMYLDGKPISPLDREQLNGGWQTITFKDGGYPLTVAGLGLTLFREENNFYGGQNYREIIFLSSLPTEMERRSIERYLAEKWGTDKSAMLLTDGDVRLFGSGTFEVEDGLVGLGGEFSGTVNLGAGATLKLTDAEGAPLQPVSFGDSIEDGVWYDPCASGAIVSYSLAPEEYRANSVYWLYNMREVFSNNQVYGLNAQSRTPSCAREARGFGPEATWIDYDCRKSLNNAGCTLRIGSDNTTDGRVFNFKTGFMVLDTSIGGGTPFLANSLGGGGEYLFKRELVERKIFNPTPSCKPFVTNANVRLNGIDGIAPDLRAFNCRPEVLSVAFSENFPLRCLGSFENKAENNRLIHGECLFYARTLTQKEIADTEAYLMKKWIGLTPAGYGDPSQLTIAGSGAVILADRAERPRFADSYSGSVTMPNSTLAFTLQRNDDGDVVVPDAIVAGKFESADTLTILVKPSFVSVAKDHLCTLIRAESWVGGENVTLDTSLLTERQAKSFSLIKEGGELKLRIKKLGLAVYVQ